jgi:UDP-N-acetyl-D-glucosamine dehydrogenase
VAYKRDIGDVRESPALDIMLILKRLGARLTYTDPHVPELRLDGVDLTSSPEETAADADCAVVITDHTAFDYARLARTARLIVDTRNALKGAEATHIVRL